MNNDYITNREGKTNSTQQGETIVHSQRHIETSVFFSIMSVGSRTRQKKGKGAKNRSSLSYLHQHRSMYFIFINLQGIMVALIKIYIYIYNKYSLLKVSNDIMIITQNKCIYKNLLKNSVSL